MIQINKLPGQKILELGGGDAPSPSSDVRVDVRAGPHTHFTADFEQPLPIQSDEFDAVLCHFCLEHLRFTKVLGFLQECHRVLKPGGVALFATPNLERQVEWIKDHPDGWNGKPLFEAASELIFGSQDYPENCHRSCMTPSILSGLFMAAGFTDVKVEPYGEHNTDLSVIAKKPNDQVVAINAETGALVKESQLDKHVTKGDVLKLIEQNEFVAKIGDELVYANSREEFDECMKELDYHKGNK
jgi:predicted SAM-dependent methyltransferase